MNFVCAAWIHLFLQRPRDSTHNKKLFSNLCELFSRSKVWVGRTILKCKHKHSAAKKLSSEVAAMCVWPLTPLMFPLRSSAGRPPLRGTPLCVLARPAVGRPNPSQRRRAYFHISRGWLIKLHCLMRTFSVCGVRLVCLPPLSLWEAGICFSLTGTLRVSAC